MSCKGLRFCERESWGDLTFAEKLQCRANCCDAARLLMCRQDGVSCPMGTLVRISVRRAEYREQQEQEREQGQTEESKVQTIVPPTPVIYFASFDSWESRLAQLDAMRAARAA